MKYLSQYIEKGVSKVLKDTGAFFAFSDKQFEEQRVEGVKYVSCGIGLICPKDNVDQYIKGMDEVIKDGIAEDIAENGLDGIIRRELGNHEAYYTGSIKSTIEALQDYPDITVERIATIYNEEKNKHHLTA